jgi:nucleotide-binding universal stress UspA family protein
MYKKIVVPLDGSDLAEAALPHARAIAERAGAELLLLRVAVSPLYIESPVDPTFSAVMVESALNMQKEAEQYLERIATPLRETGLSVTTRVHDGGTAAETILDEAKQFGADLIVMSTHGRSGISRWLIGSVADKVVHGAQIPVLLIRSHQ